MVADLVMKVKWLAKDKLTRQRCNEIVSIPIKNRNKKIEESPSLSTRDHQIHHLFEEIKKINNFFQSFGRGLYGWS